MFHVKWRTVKNPRPYYRTNYRQKCNVKQSEFYGENAIICYFDSANAIRHNWIVSKIYVISKNNKGAIFSLADLNTMS